MTGFPIYDREITAPRLTVPGFVTKSFTFNPTVGSFVVSKFQQREFPGVRKIRVWIHRPSATWRVQIAATKDGHDRVTEAVRSIVAEYNFATASSLETVDR